MQYHQHNQRQYEMILSVSRKLFIECGIDSVSLGAIANECGISRGTLYRYFKNKEALLWSIVHQHYQALGKNLHQRLESLPTPHTAFMRYTVFFQEMLHTFEYSPDVFLFMGIFDKKYQTETSALFSPLYASCFAADDFKSKDTVKFLEEDFSDGSIRTELTAHALAVSAAYLCYYTVLGVCKDEKELSVKYGLKGVDLVRSIFKQFLCGISSETPAVSL